MARRAILLATLVLVLPATALPQYWADYVLEKGFDGRSYFLQPHRIQGLQVRNLDPALQWIRPDSVTDWTLQPALLSSLTGTKLYVDLKGKTEERMVSPWHVYPAFGYENALFIPPYMARPVNRELKPLLSVLWLGNVSQTLLPGLKYGLSYELIHHQGPYYERVPIWYYGARDAFGQYMEAARKFPELPINLKKTGLDQKTETAHLFNAVLSYRLSRWLSAGIGAGFTRMDLDGNYTRFNDYSQPSREPPYTSVYFNSKTTAARLDQHEMRAGVVLTLPGNRSLGLYGGRVSGAHTQESSELDTSRYQYGDDPGKLPFSRSLHRHESVSHWRHEGASNYFGLNGILPVRDGVLLRFRAERHQANTDLTNGDVASDTSFSHYSWYDSQNDRKYHNVYRSAFHDRRNGDGTERVTRTLGGAGLVIPVPSLGKPARPSTLTIAFFWQENRRTLEDYEDARVYRFSAQDSATPWSVPYTRTGVEDKTVRFRKNVRISSLNLPVMLDLWLGRHVVLHVGAVKSFRETRVDEVVDIWYRTDSLTVIKNGTTTTETKPERIDRYEATPVRQSSADMIFRGGISFLPTRILQIDLAMRGRWLDLDAWQLALLVNL